MKKTDFYDFSPSRLQSLMNEWNEPAYRTNQLISAAWSLKSCDFRQATTLPGSLREKLSAYFELPAPLHSKNGFLSQDGTYKALFQLEDHVSIESVAIPKAKRLTFCLSTQAGCAMGCRFCATAKLGFIRNLRPTEIIGQIRGLSALVQRQPTNLVFMGMGEPLQNLDSLRDVLDIITHPKAMNWSQNKSIISTCGWLPGIEAITKSPIKAKLALSLNAANNTVRSRLMPVNKRFQIDKILSAIRHYSMVTEEQVYIEYVLIKGINDSVDDARSLSQLLRNYNVKINLIPYNSVSGIDFQAPTETALSAFLSELRKSRLVITLRTARGKTIGAACGQLAGQKTRTSV